MHSSFEITFSLGEAQEVSDAIKEWSEEADC